MNARILIAESNENIRQLTTLTLRRRGYHVLEATDGQTALAVAHIMQPDFIILAADLPTQNGLAIAQTLAADPVTAATPVLLLLDKRQAISLLSWLATSHCAFLIKPFAPRELIARVERIMTTFHAYA